MGGSPSLLRRAWMRRILVAWGLSGWAWQRLVHSAEAWPQGMLRVRGKVQVNGQDAQEGQPVAVGDRISTGVQAEAVYVMGRDAFLLRAGSQVQHDHDGVKQVLRVLTGRMLSVFGPGEKTLHIPTATVGIRGTACYIEADSQQSYFCLCYGRADVSPLADPLQALQIETQHHDHPIYISAMPGMPVMRAAPVVNHTDAELVMLEALVGRQPPFVGRDGLTHY